MKAILHILVGSDPPDLCDLYEREQGDCPSAEGGRKLPAQAGMPGRHRKENSRMRANSSNTNDHPGRGSQVHEPDVQSTADRVPLQGHRRAAVEISVAHHDPVIEGGEKETQALKQEVEIFIRTPS